MFIIVTDNMRYSHYSLVNVNVIIPGKRKHKVHILITKPTRCLRAVSKSLWHIPLLCTVKNSRWCTEELSETC